MADVRIARKDFIKGLGAAVAACAAAPALAASSNKEAGSKVRVVTTATLPFKVRSAVKIVARPDSRV